MPESGRTGFLLISKIPESRLYLILKKMETTPDDIIRSEKNSYNTNHKISVIQTRRKMNTHYVPRLMLRAFSENDKVNSFDVINQSFSTKKMKKTFAAPDIYCPELENLFAKKLEGPFGDLLNNYLLSKDTIQINRKQNMLLRKFILINWLRNPVLNQPLDSVIETLGIKEHPSIKANEFLMRVFPEMREFYEANAPSELNYMKDLEIVMETDSIDEMEGSAKWNQLSESGKMEVNIAMSATIAFWDCSTTEQEFILPCVTGASEMDYLGKMHKTFMLMQKIDKLKEEGADEGLIMECSQRMLGSIFFSDNYHLYPLSPTRIMVCFSPFFRLYYPTLSGISYHELYPAVFSKEEFATHFFYPTRMELFEPCISIFNKAYIYKVKQLTKKEMMRFNAHLIDAETQEFVFHDYNRIRDSLWFYDNEIKFAFPKKHDFRRWV